MKEIFEQIATEHNWYFEYGRKDFMNLEATPSVEQEYFLFLDPIEENTLFDDFSNEESKTYSGRFLLLMKSDFDRAYHTQSRNDPNEGKYQMYIIKCKEELKKIPQAFACEDIFIKQWKTYEAINEFSDNFDGVLVNYIIEKH